MGHRLEAFRGAIAAAALAAAVLATLALPSGPFSWPVVAAVVVLGTAALQFPLHVSLTLKVSMASAVFFGAVLLLPPVPAAAAAAAAEVISTTISVTRRMLVSGQAPPAGRVAATLLFNASADFLAVLAGGLVLAGRGQALALAPEQLLLMAAAGTAMYAVNVSIAGVADALRSGTSIRRALANTHRTVALPYLLLYVVGGLTALISRSFPAAPLLMVIPALFAYGSLRRAVEMSQDTIRAVERMADMVDRRDPYTYDHSRRVSEYSVLIARRLGLSRDETELLRLAGKVHDLGKIGIPDSVLLKPGRLEEPEEQQMQAHPRIGYDILSEFREYAKVRELVLTHHERFTGGGYPNGTVAAGLPLLAQVIPVADSLDAMTTARPYRDAMPWAVALERLGGGAGSQWNPQVVEAALEVFAGRVERRPLEAPALLAVQALRP